jgi:general secretion pathway protein K
VPYLKRPDISATHFVRADGAVLTTKLRRAATGALDSRTIRRGSSLLFVLWAIMLTSFAVVGLVSHLSRGVDESIHAEKQFRARLLLQSARTVAAHPDIEWGDPLLRQRVSSSTSYEVTITTEGVYLAVNQLAASAVQRQFARRLFEKWGMDTRHAEALTDSIADWIDPDDRPRTHGAERDYYLPLGSPMFPFNAPFRDIDDLLLVRGFEELDHLRPDWRRFFTVYGDGTIDIHRTSAELLEVLFDVTRTEISRFISARLGPDGLPDTIDDRRFTSLAEVRAFLDVPQPNYAAVSALLTLEHPIKRTECIAWAGDLRRRLTIIKGPGVDFIEEE